MTGGMLFLCFPAVKSTSMVAMLVEQLHHTDIEVGINLIPDKDIRKRP